MWTSMWTTLAALTLLSASRADSSGQIVPCCSNFSSRRIHVIRECYEQKARRNCGHAFLVANRKGVWCVRPEAAWLRAKIATGKLLCPPDLSF